MEELTVVESLACEDLFVLFRQQLKKDFEGAGINGDFCEALIPDFTDLKNKLQKELDHVLRNNQLTGLLYRIDISEVQLKNYQAASPRLLFEEILAETIIKRILQKVILKKRFSS